MEIQNKDLRNFGLIWTIISFLIGTYIIIKGGKVNYIPWATGIFLLLISYFFPVFLKYFYLVWMKIGNILGFINSHIIMIFLFYFIFTPVALILKLFGKDLLNKKINKSHTSYWVKKENTDSSLQYQF